MKLWQSAVHLYSWLSINAFIEAAVRPVEMKPQERYKLWAEILEFPCLWNKHIPPVLSH